MQEVRINQLPYQLRNSAVAAAVLALLVLAIVWFGGSDKAPHPTPIDATTYESEGVSDAIRKAMLDGEAVEVLRHEAKPPSVSGVGATPQDPVLSTQRYENRQLSPSEKAKALSIVGRLLQAANSPFALDGKSEVEQETHIAQKLKDRALLAAAERMITDGRCFLTKGAIADLSNDSSWYYWNVDFPMREGERRWTELLYVPIELSRFPEVADRKARLSAIRDYQRADAAFAWNSKSWEERQRLVVQAKEARQECSRVDEQLSSTNEPEIRARLGIRRRELLLIMSLVPRKYDPVTLESRP